MPYKSDAQARLMRAVAHSPEFAKKVGISQSVGRKFEEHKAEGGSMRAAALKKVFAGKETPAEERKEKTAAKKAGMSYKAAEKKFEGEKYCGGGRTKGYAEGGTTSFKEAFAEARKSGDKTFEWNGKKYTTDLASPSVGDGMARSVRSGSTSSDATRSRGDMLAALSRAEREAPEGTSKLAREKIAAARRAAETEYGAAASGRDMSEYRPRYTPPGSAPKATTQKAPDKEPFRSMVDDSYTTYAKGGTTALPINDDMGSDTTYDRKKAMERKMPPAPKPAKRTLAIEPDMGSVSYKKGGSVRGVGIAKRGFGCTGMK